MTSLSQIGWHGLSARLLALLAVLALCLSPAVSGLAGEADGEENVISIADLLLENGITDIENWHGQTMETAIGISLDAAYTDTITTEGPVWYRFTTDGVSGRYYATMSNSLVSRTIYSSAGEPLGANPLLSANTTYYTRVSTSQTTDQSFTMRIYRPHSVGDYEGSPYLLPVGTARSDFMVTSADTRYFMIKLDDAADSGRYNMTLSGAFADCCVRMTDGMGTTKMTLASNGTASALLEYQDDGMGNPTFFFISVYAPDGTGAVGSFTLTVTRPNTVGETRASAISMALGRGYSDQIKARGDERWYQFTSWHAGQYDISFSAFTFADLELYDGSTLMRVFTSGASLTLEENHKYYIRVYDAEKYNTGSFSLSVAMTNLDDHLSFTINDSVIEPGGDLSLTILPDSTVDMVRVFISDPANIGSYFQIADNYSVSGPCTFTYRVDDAGARRVYMQAHANGIWNHVTAFQTLQVTSALPALTTPEIQEPEGEAITIATGTDVRVSWSYPVGANSFNLLLSVDGATPVQYGVKNYAANTITMIGATDFAKEGVYVLSIYAAGPGYASNVVPARVTITVTEVPTPKLLSVTPINGNLVVVWQTVKDATGYRLMRTQKGLETELIAAVTGNTYTDVNVTSTLEYEYYVVALRDNLMSKDSNKITGVVPLEMPSIDSVTMTGATSVKLQWHAMEGATGYSVYRAAAAAGPYKYVGSSNKKDSKGIYYYSDTSLTTGATYYYRIKSYSKNFSPAWTSPYSPVVPIRMVPVAPVVSASAKNGTITVAWKAVPGASGYRVYRSVDGAAYENAVLLTDAGMTDSNVTVNKTYRYKVEAVSGSLVSPMSNVAELYLMTKPTLYAPAIPTSAAVTLSWSASSGALGYNVYRITGSEKTAALVLQTTQLGMTDTTVKLGETYQYYVCAVNGSSLSQASETRTVAFKLATPVLTGKALSKTSVQLTWKAIANATEYKIYRAGATGSFTLLATVDDTDYTNTKLTAGAIYRYHIVAVRGALVSDASNVITVTPQLAMPGSLKATILTDTSLSLTWNYVTDASSYKIEMSSDGGSTYRQIYSTTYHKYTVTGLVKGATYSFRIRAYSNKADQYSEYAYTTPSAVKMALDTPVIKSLTATSATTVTLTWEPVVGATEYRILRLNLNKSGDTVGRVGSSDTASFVHTGLSSTGAYRYYVVAYAGSMVSGRSQPVSIVMTFGAPRVESATRSDTLQASLKWSVVAGANSYYIYRKGETDTSFIKVQETKSPACLDTVPTNGLYTYRIYAHTGTLRSSKYAQTDVQVGLAAPTVSAPVLLSATSARITWKAVGGANRYQVYRSVNGGSYELLSTVSTVTLDDKNLTEGKKYTYKVRATILNTKDVSADSNVVTVTAGIGKPTGLSATVSGTSITLTWNKAANADAYHVYRKYNGGEYVLVKKVTTNSLQDTGLKTSGLYTYTVTAAATIGDADVLGMRSDAYDVLMKLDAPANLKVSIVTFGSVKLTWDAVPNAVGYNVYRNGKYITSIRRTSYDITGLDNGDSYQYSVNAYTRVNGAKKTSLKSAVSVTMKLGTPSGLKAATPALGTVRLTWNAVPLATGYNIYAGTKYIGSTRSLTYSVYGIANDTTVSYRVNAYLRLPDGTVSSAKTDALSVTMKLATPSAPSATLLDGGKARVSWNKVAMATGYSLYISVNGGSYQYAGSVRTNQSTLTLSDTGSICFRVKAYVKASGKTTTSGMSAPSEAIVAE